MVVGPQVSHLGVVVGGLLGHMPITNLQPHNSEAFQGRLPKTGGNERVHLFPPHLGLLVVGWN